MNKEMMLVLQLIEKEIHFQKMNSVSDIKNYLKVSFPEMSTELQKNITDFFKPLLSTYKGEIKRAEKKKTSRKKASEKSKKKNR